jgi:hypothetical protein
VHAKEYAIAVGLPENADHAALNVASTVHVRGLQARPQALVSKAASHLGQPAITEQSRSEAALTASRSPAGPLQACPQAR